MKINCYSITPEAIGASLVLSESIVSPFRYMICNTFIGNLFLFFINFSVIPMFSLFLRLPEKRSWAVYKHESNKKVCLSFIFNSVCFSAIFSHLGNNWAYWVRERSPHF